MAFYSFICFALVYSALPFLTLVSGKTAVRLQHTAGSGVYGIINIKHNGKWGTVCNDYWDMKDTFVACRQLGFDRAVGYVRYGRGTGPVLLNNINCNGSENSLEDCAHGGWGKSVSACHKHIHDIGVMCSSRTGPQKENTTLRLQPDTKEFGIAGILQVFHNNQWGTVCHWPFEWDIQDTTVACRQLGFSKAVGYWYEARREGKVWINNVQCTGQETSLHQCPHGIVKQDNTRCKDNRHDVGIVCSGTKENVRLVDGVHENEGRIEVKTEGTWGTVCGDYGWTIENSNVICRMLGYERAITNKKFGAGRKSLPIRLQQVSCKGCEISVAECQITNYSLPNCTHKNDAGVVCLPKGEAEVAVRLVDRDASFVRRVEVRYHGIWRSICTNNWDIRDAHVICRMKGYQKAAVTTTTSKGSHDRVWLDYLDCSGSEKTIDDCKNVTLNWMNKPCSNDLRAGVICFKEKLKLQFQIVNKRAKHAGKLEVDSHGTKGNLCIDNLDLNAAHVICHMLGYREAVTVSSWSQQSIAGTSFSLSMQCDGNERSIDECKDVTLNQVNKCKSKEVAGIVCKPNTKYDGKEELRLVGGSSDQEGRVEVKRHGVWGTLCSVGWDMLDANVVCRMKGYKGAITAYKRFPEGSGPIWFAGLNCKGHENSTQDCDRNQLDKTTSCSHKDDVGVVCYSEKASHLQVNLEMNNSSSLYEGRVNILVNNETGTIDDEQWDIHDADVVCRMLTSTRAIAAISLFREEPGKVFFSKVRCYGTEESLEMCDHGGWGAGAKDHHGHDAGVICARPLAVPQARMMADSTKSKDGAVAGLSILVVILIMVIVGLVLWYFFKLRKEVKNKNSDQTQGSQLENQKSDEQVVHHSRGKNVKNAQESEKSSMI